jgi:hypothetical protein
MCRQLAGIVLESVDVARSWKQIRNPATILIRRCRGQPSAINPPACACASFGSTRPWRISARYHRRPARQRNRPGPLQLPPDPRRPHPGCSRRRSAIRASGQPDSCCHPAQPGVPARVFLPGTPRLLTGGSAAGHRPPSLLPDQRCLFPCAGQQEAGAREPGQRPAGAEPGLAGVEPGAPQPRTDGHGRRGGSGRPIVRPDSCL